MPLNASESTQVAQALLKNFGEDAAHLGRTLKYMSSFTAGQVNLLTTVKTVALTWQPYIDTGLSIDFFLDQVQTIYDQTSIT